MTLADGVDLLFSGPGFPQVPANVAGIRIPLASMHYFPMLPNGQLSPGVPAPLVRTAMAMLDRPQRFVTKAAEDAAPGI